MRHPALFYASLTAIVCGAAFYANYSFLFPAFSSLPRMAFDADVAEWMLWFNLYYGTLHFYFDGRLWKLRRPALRAQM